MEYKFSEILSVPLFFQVPFKQQNPVSCYKCYCFIDCPAHSLMKLFNIPNIELSGTSCIHNIFKFLNNLKTMKFT